MSATYGSGTCAAWDASMPECHERATPPSHCSEPWCYVNASLCRTSQTLYTRSYLFPSVEDLFYSYATCGGDAAPFAAFELIQEASHRQTLNLVVPSDRYTPYHYKEGALAQYEQAKSTELTHYRADDVPWEGILVQYIKLLAEHEHPGFSKPAFSLTWASVGSRVAHPASPWSAAVNDVALGIAEAGLSLFWLTSERLEMSSFTSNLLTDVFYLFVPEPRIDDSYLTRAGAILAPFDREVWFALICVILVTGALQSYLTMHVWWSGWAARVQWKHASRRRRALLLIERVAEGWYDSFMSVVTGGPRMDEEHRLAERLMNLGVGLFIVLFIAACRAQRSIELCCLAPRCIRELHCLPLCALRSGQECLTSSARPWQIRPTWRLTSAPPTLATFGRTLRRRRAPKPRSASTRCYRRHWSTPTPTQTSTSVR